MVEKVDQTLKEIDETIGEFSKQYQEFQQQNPLYEMAANASINTREENARINLTFAFALNSLYYSMLRIQGKKSVIKDHPVLGQIEIVKQHYQKLDKVLRKREEKASTRVNKEASMRIVQAVVGQNKRIIDQQQQEQLESNRKRFKVSAKDFLSSDSGSEDEEDDKQGLDNQKQTIENYQSDDETRKSVSVQSSASKLQTLDQIAKNALNKNKAARSMHGATVVPEPAYLKLKKLLGKK